MICFCFFTEISSWKDKGTNSEQSNLRNYQPSSQIIQFRRSSLRKSVVATSLRFVKKAGNGNELGGGDANMEGDPAYKQLKTLICFWTVSGSGPNRSVEDNTKSSFPNPNFKPSKFSPRLRILTCPLTNCLGPGLESTVRFRDLFRDWAALVMLGLRLRLRERVWLELGLNWDFDRGEIRFWEWEWEWNWVWRIWPRRKGVVVILICEV